MTESLTLSDGTVFNNSYAVLSGSLLLYIKGQNLRTVFDALIEPENTDRIVYTQNNGATINFDGFTKLVAVRDEGNGLTTAVLMKEVTG